MPLLTLGESQVTEYLLSVWFLGGFSLGDDLLTASLEKW